MNSDINLLPWRALKRQQEKKAFIGFVLLLLGFGLIVLCLMKHDVASSLHSQEIRNARLQDEIVLFGRQIKEINRLITRCQLLIAQRDSLKKLQLNRVSIVHFFDELVNIVPNGVYLLEAEQRGEQIKLVGRAQSNHAISNMLHNIELNAWFQHPTLT